MDMTGLSRPAVSYTDRRVIRIGLALLLVIAAALVVRWVSAGFEPAIETHNTRSGPAVETPPMCPWREPARDLAAFFPGATGYRTETRILSGQRVELARRMGRPATGEENALYVYRVYRGSSLQGSIATRRVKGEYGVIEIVVAVSASGRIQGVRIQRLREPPAVTRALTSTGWLARFRGKSEDGRWELGQDLPAVPPPARISATAVVQGIRSLLIEINVAEKLQPQLILSRS